MSEDLLSSCGKTGGTDFIALWVSNHTGKTIWGFSGFTYEELTTDGTHPRCEVTDEMLSLLDVLVDGRFVEELKNLTLRFRGSSNQRLIDLNASRQAGHLCFLPDRPRGQ